MRRADRLFEILQLLRGGRLRTSRDLAERLEVSTRTIWRDIAALQAQGVPIDGERGFGYILRESFFLPPLALSPGEMEALAWGVRLVETYGDSALAEAARELSIKINSVSSETRSDAPPAMLAFSQPSAQAAQNVLGEVRQAIASQHKLDIVYTDLKERDSSRVIRPLNLEFWGHVWTLTAWCELREDFRVFRCDRITSCTPLAEKFRNEPGKRFQDYLEAMAQTSPKKDGS